MNKFFQVLKNLNHDGNVYKLGQYIEESAEKMEQAIATGAVRLIAGAKSVEEAIKIVKNKDYASGIKAPAEVKAPVIPAPAEKTAEDAEPKTPAVGGESEQGNLGEDAEKVDPSKL